MIPDLACMIGITVQMPMVVHLTVGNVVPPLGIALMTHNTYQSPEKLVTDSRSPGVVKSGQDLVPPVSHVQSVEPQNSIDALPDIVSPNSCIIPAHPTLHIEGSLD